MLAGVQAFAPMVPKPMRGAALDATVAQTLQTAPGPNIFWGSAGVLLGYEENEIKGATGFTMFAQQAAAAGIDLNSGSYTVLAPTDIAMTDIGRPLTAEEIKLHMIPGSVAMDGLLKDQTTVQGKTLSYRRFARQNYLDNAIIGQTPQGPATGEVHPSHQCDNGWVHSIAFVLTLDYATLSAEEGISTQGNK